MLARVSENNIPSGKSGIVKRGCWRVENKCHLNVNKKTIVILQHFSWSFSRWRNTESR